MFTLRNTDIVNPVLHRQYLHCVIHTVCDTVLHILCLYCVTQTMFKPFYTDHFYTVLHRTRFHVYTVLHRLCAMFTLCFTDYVQCLHFVAEAMCHVYPVLHKLCAMLTLCYTNYVPC